MSKIIIVDTGSSNILSLKKAVEIFDNNVEVTTNSNKILSADKILFPGVGAFKKVMDNLEKNKLTETLMKTRDKKICLVKRPSSNLMQNNIFIYKIFRI